MDHSLPEHVAHLFKGQRVIIDEALDLSTTLRSHLASDVHEWVAALLDGQLTKAKSLAGNIRGAGFNLYVTRRLEDAKRYVRDRYVDNIESRYGLLASSKAKELPGFGIDATFQATRRFRPGPWYNDPPESPLSCRQLNTVATEFQCQGLELDFPIVGWDTDLVWNGKRWISKTGRSTAKDPHRLRINSYRVLLTRGRDGMLIFVPPLEVLDTTFDALKAAGALQLELVVRAN